MKLFFARLLLRLREVDLHIAMPDGDPIEDYVAWTHRTRHGLVVWGVWYDREWGEDGEKLNRAKLNRYLIPWDKIDYYWIVTRGKAEPR